MALLDGAFCSGTAVFERMVSIVPLSAKRCKGI